MLKQSAEDNDDYDKKEEHTESSMRTFLVIKIPIVQVVSRFTNVIKKKIRLSKRRVYTETIGAFVLFGSVLYYVRLHKFRPQTINKQKKNSNTLCDSKRQ